MRGCREMEAQSFSTICVGVSACETAARGYIHNLICLLTTILELIIKTDNQTNN